MGIIQNFLFWTTLVLDVLGKACTGLSHRQPEIRHIMAKMSSSRWTQVSLVDLLLCVILVGTHIRLYSWIWPKSNQSHPCLAQLDLGSYLLFQQSILNLSPRAMSYLPLLSLNRLRLAAYLPAQGRYTSNAWVRSSVQDWVAWPKMATSCLLAWAGASLLFSFDFHLIQVFLLDDFLDLRIIEIDYAF